MLILSVCLKVLSFWKWFLSVDWKYVQELIWSIHNIFISLLSVWLPWWKNCLCFGHQYTQIPICHRWILQNEKGGMLFKKKTKNSPFNSVDVVKSFSENDTINFIDIRNVRRWCLFQNRKKHRALAATAELFRMSCDLPGVKAGAFYCSEFKMQQNSQPFWRDLLSK